MQGQLDESAVPQNLVCRETSKAHPFSWSSGFGQVEHAGARPDVGVAARRTIVWCSDVVAHTRGMVARSGKNRPTAKSSRTIAKNARVIANNARAVPTARPSRRDQPVDDDPLKGLFEQVQREKREEEEEQERRRQAALPKGWGSDFGIREVGQGDQVWWRRRRWYESPRLWFTLVVLVAVIVAVVLFAVG